MGTYCIPRELGEVLGRIHRAVDRAPHTLFSLKGFLDGIKTDALTTLYGAILAFVVFNPIADKLENRTSEEVSQKKLAIVGVESILKGDNTMVIQSKLEAFLSPQARAKISESS